MLAARGDVKTPSPIVTTDGFLELLSCLRYAVKIATKECHFLPIFTDKQMNSSQLGVLSEVGKPNSLSECKIFCF